MPHSTAKTPIPITDISAPATISKHGSSMAQPSVESNEPPIDVIKETQQSNKIVEPLTVSDTNVEPTEPDTTPSQSNQLTSEQAATVNDPEQQPVLEPRAKVTPDAYQAIDALPDPTQQHTTELTNAMEGPRIYDTTEYVVPISKTLHSHSKVGVVIAGLVSAAVVVALVYLAAITLT